MTLKGQSKRDWQNNWLKNRRLVWLEEHGPCAICKSSEQLEVDHIDPNQKISHRVWSWREDRRNAELAKCQVLCHKCHDKKTYDEARKSRKHGTTTSYRLGCRCKNCKIANLIRVYDERGRGIGRAISPEHAKELIQNYIKKNGGFEIIPYAPEEFIDQRVAEKQEENK